jgi:hypothetical protein
MPWLQTIAVLSRKNFSVRTPVEGKIETYTATWSHRSFKAIRKNGGTGVASGTVPGGERKACRFSLRRAWSVGQQPALTGRGL